MSDQQIMNEAEESLLHVYNRFPVVFERGEGCYLYDVNGKDYLDFGSGIGVMGLGYGDPEYTAAVEAQLRTLTHTSNLFYTPQVAEAAAAVAKESGMDRVFFTNSGAEANEGAIKAAKKYAYERDGHAGHTIIAMEHSFHGRTVGALSVTGTAHYREPFYPLMDGVRFAKFNDLESVKALMDDTVCAVIVEPVQGEGGLLPADPDFLQGLRNLCTPEGALLIFDEVQCGMGRTGEMFAWQHYGVRPDILTSAKALGAGVPVGAFMLTEEVAKASLAPGDHGTTYGGNPLVCAAVSAVADIMEKRNICGHVQELTPVLEAALDDLQAAYPELIKGHRGLGFMQGLVMNIPPVNVVKAGLKEGLVTLTAGADVLRLLPPLVITEADIEEMKQRLSRALEAVK